MTFTWDDALEQFGPRRERARGLGGEKAVARQHAHGKYTVRERIERFAASFTEVGEFATFVEKDGFGRPADTVASSYVCGLAEVDGRTVALGGEDFTVRGGVPTIYLDRMKGGLGGFVEDLAHEYRLPLLMLMEGVGGDVAYQDVKGHAMLVSYLSFSRCFELLAEVPVLTAVLGPAAGGTAARAAMSHFSVMTRNSSVFAGGPPVVRRALGIELTKEELGGPEIHTAVSGVIDNLAEDEDDAFRQMKTVLAYLPQNVWELPPRGDRTDPVDRPGDALLKIMPENRRRAYDPKHLVSVVADTDSLFEIGPGWGRSLRTMLGRIDGIPVGILANDPRHIGGSLDAAAAEKQARFIDICSTFHLPLVYFVDVPGFMVGPDAERSAVLRKGIRAIQAITEAEVPIVTVYVRKAYGMATNATSNPDHLGLRLAWPTAEWGDLPVEGGVAAGYRREIEEADDPDAYRREVEERLLKEADPWRTAEAFGVEMMIDPRETRPLVARFLNAALPSMATRLGPPQRQWTTRL